ncbi:MULTISPECIES: hypothetical protein [unclassified Enterobacter cloacae complex]|uniref:hypothetical protein n=1 Tax=unclassified Enterobacter cloacae complex TaxID=2757714 RepID=UPI0018743555|nr:MULTISPECIES: hypothetical protein [unclassified Enterobacter cloacae complex]MBE4946305.1 hypothetical protein [Enterobacter cloacae complex sp. P1B]MBE4971472.1 hypothetical protein [Enterobacter cloacae complex sp. P11RS]
MKITVSVTKEELSEMEMSAPELNRTVLEDLDNARDYAGFNVEVLIVEEVE